MKGKQEKGTGGMDRSNRLYAKFFKRFFDVFFSLIVVIVFSPLIGLLALLVRIKHGSPILFSPTRPGKDERIFKLYKFRTMTNARDKDGVLLPEKERITKVGKFLRASSLDELPELINIIKGDMSFVGPRPLPMKYLPYYTEEQRLRHSVRPGLTGLAQISGRNNLPWNQRFDTDIEYVKTMSLKKDISIIVDTVAKVFKGADVVVPGDTSFYQFDTYRVIEREGTPHSRPEGASAREIGSDFWMTDEEGSAPAEENRITFPDVQDQSYTVSGRSAADLVLRDILSTRQIRRALIPSYCSFSMLQPFIQHDIPYKFYDVKWDGSRFVYDLSGRESADVVLIMSCFGLNHAELNARAERLKKRGCIVIEDITHSLLSDVQGCAAADYYIASLRKWAAIPTGGWIGKKGGKLSEHPDKDGSLAAQKPLTAMEKKRSYILGETDNKEEYLVPFSSFESDLVQLDSLLMMDELSQRRFANLDRQEIAGKRKENARCLIRGLSDLKALRVLYKESDLDRIVPLYVPVLVDAKDRDRLQEHLASQGIYCPVIWPERCGAKAGLRRGQLSLICDQRYGINDMNIMVRVIHQYYEKESAE